MTDDGRMRRVALITLAAVAIGAVALQAASTPLTSYDEPLWYLRSQRPVWRTDGPHDYPWATDVPGGCRLVYGAALDVFGLDGLPNRQPVYKVEAYRANWENACYAPADAVLAMRGCNVVLYLSGLLALYVVAVSVLKRPVWALAAVSPLVLSPTFPLEIVPRVGPDALLMATLCLFLLVWTSLDGRGKTLSAKAAVLMGVLGGLCTFAKVNGALAPIAFAAWAAYRGRGWARIGLPMTVLAITGVGFYALNPAFYAEWPWTCLIDILQRRAVAGAALDKIYGTMGWTAVFAGAVRVWPLFLVALAVLWRVRRVRALEPVLWWGIIGAAGNLAVINLPLPRYIGPVELGIYYPAALAVAWILANENKSRNTGTNS